MIIKICGMQCPELAAKAVALGARWIGIVFAKRSIRRVSREIAKELAKAVFESGGIPVAVFEDISSEDMLAICKKTGIRMIQVHGIQAIDASQFLPEDYQRIYAFPANLECSKRKYGFPERDFILFDGPCAGSGESFNWSVFDYKGHYRWILSGGLTAKNVALGIQTLNPFGIDVSSGVENKQGEKSISKIQTFIGAVI